MEEMAKKVGRKKKSEKQKKTIIEEIFEQAIQINMQIDAKLEQIKYWREFAETASAAWGKVKRGGMRRNSKIEDCICRIADIEDTLRSDIDRLIELKRQTMEIVEKMDVPEYKNLLIHRYICGKKWEDVAGAMGYSYVHTVSRLHPKALSRLAEILNAEEKERF